VLTAGPTFAGKRMMGLEPHEIRLQGVSSHSGTRTRFVPNAVIARNDLRVSSRDGRIDSRYYGQSEPTWKARFDD
jgi:hypothetical protein